MPNRFSYIKSKLFCFTCFLSFAGCNWFSSTEPFLFTDPYPIQVTGVEYEWLVLYPGPDGILHTQDDITSKKNIYLPQAMHVQIHLKSKDYLYFLELPAYRQIGAAVPDLYHFIEFETGKKGISILKGNQMCAYDHVSLLGHVIVENKSRFQKTLEKIEENGKK